MGAGDFAAADVRGGDVVVESFFVTGLVVAMEDLFAVVFGFVMAFVVVEEEGEEEALLLTVVEVAEGGSLLLLLLLLLLGLVVTVAGLAVMTCAFLEGGLLGMELEEAGLVLLGAGRLVPDKEEEEDTAAAVGLVMLLLFLVLRLLEFGRAPGFFFCAIVVEDSFLEAKNLVIVLAAEVALALDVPVPEVAVDEEDTAERFA